MDHKTSKDLASAIKKRGSRCEIDHDTVKPQTEPCQASNSGVQGALHLHTERRQWELPTRGVGPVDTTNKHDHECVA